MLAPVLRTGQEAKVGLGVQAAHERTLQRHDVVDVEVVAVLAKGTSCAVILADGLDVRPCRGCLLFGGASTRCAFEIGRLVLLVLDFGDVLVGGFVLSLALARLLVAVWAVGVFFLLSNEVGFVFFVVRLVPRVDALLIRLVVGSVLGEQALVVLFAVLALAGLNGFCVALTVLLLFLVQARFAVRVRLTLDLVNNPRLKSQALL